MRRGYVPPEARPEHIRPSSIRKQRQVSEVLTSVERDLREGGALHYYLCVLQYWLQQLSEDLTCDLVRTHRTTLAFMRSCSERTFDNDGILPKQTTEVTQVSIAMYFAAFYTVGPSLYGDSLPPLLEAVLTPQATVSTSAVLLPWSLYESSTTLSSSAGVWTLWSASQVSFMEASDMDWEPARHYWHVTAQHTLWEQTNTRPLQVTFPCIIATHNAHPICQDTPERLERWLQQRPHFLYIGPYYVLRVQPYNIWGLGRRLEVWLAGCTVALQLLSDYVGWTRLPLRATSAPPHFFQELVRANRNGSVQYWLKTYRKHARVLCDISPALYEWKVLSLETHVLRPLCAFWRCVCLGPQAQTQLLGENVQRRVSSQTATLLLDHTEDSGFFNTSWLEGRLYKNIPEAVLRLMTPHPHQQRSAYTALLARLVQRHTWPHVAYIPQTWLSLVYQRPSELHHHLLKIPVPTASHQRRSEGKKRTVTCLKSSSNVQFNSIVCFNKSSISPKRHRPLVHQILK